MQRRKFPPRAAAATFISANAFANSKMRGQSQYSETGQPPLTDSSSGAAARRIPRATNPGTMRGEMLYRALGTTGVEVSAIGMGASLLGRTTADADTAVP